MNDTMNKLAYSLFQKSSISECSTEEIKTLAEKFPFFATAQLLLTEKLKETKDPAYKNQLQLTSLYFNNPLWLDYILNGEKTDLPYAASSTEQSLKEIPAEDFYNDEIVVTNTRYEIPVSVLQKEEVSKETGTVIAEKETMVAETEPLLFEPYHTVDYFASQGIKPVQEEKPADRFGQQLKSFTEWLKTLKRIPVQEIVKAVDTTSEEKVIHLAEHSIEKREVVTEAMAEVWVKQGQPEKAIEVYNKLSLLNPSKSSYFASLIEDLKKL
ncbi:MAG: hypothetical protein EPN92_00170 [Chitinophagaceae bacterium]|nr:MAG: hypothetical protein EPN92_00170 [Chitinophagaceae bacterium]